MLQVRLLKRTKGGVLFIGGERNKRLRVSSVALGAAEEGARGQAGPMENSLVKVGTGGQQRGGIHCAEVNLSGGHDGDNSRNSRMDEVAGEPAPWFCFFFCFLLFALIEAEEEFSSQKQTAKYKTLKKQDIERGKDGCTFTCVLLALIAC